jgi:hypothetical protein
MGVFRLSFYKIVFFLRLGVSICLDVISIEISISTPKKYQSRRSQFISTKSWFISTKSRFISKKSRFLTNISICLDWSWFVSIVSISLDDLDKNLDTSLSRLKSLDFKNLDRDKMKVDLDRQENLDGFQKLVSTLRTFSISILICLDVETTNLNFFISFNKKVTNRVWYHLFASTSLALV